MKRVGGRVAGAAAGAEGEPRGGPLHGAPVRASSRLAKSDPGECEAINHHTVGSLTIPRASIKWV